MRDISHVPPLLARAAGFGAILVAMLAGPVACGSPEAPSEGAIVTFRVTDETFRVLLTRPEQVEAARAAQAGAAARIPSGRIVAGMQVNSGWSWHLVDVAFVELAIELCDGRPSDVERAGPGYAEGRFCPWGAEVIDIQTL